MSRNRYDWSKLCPDLLRTILEGLTTKDFHRARTICSNWYSVSTTCKRALYPWRIMFKKYSILLLNPGEDEIHEIEHPGIDFTKNHVMASCSNWLLMVDLCLHFYLLNVFTRERINLPSMEASVLGQQIHREEKWESFIERTDLVSSKKMACLWINERTWDYVVAWSSKRHYLFSYKKGDDSWSNLEDVECVSMAYKDEKLYVYTLKSCIKILDLSGDSLKEVVEGDPYCNYPFRFSQPGECIWTTRVTISNSGEVLIVLSLKGLGEKHMFYIFKMNVESSNWERVDSLGGEMLVFGHGVTIRAPIKDVNDWGIKRDAICFRGYDLWPASLNNFNFTHEKETNCGVFNLVTSTISWTKALDGSFLKSFWFDPGYA